MRNEAMQPKPHEGDVVVENLDADPLLEESDITLTFRLDDIDPSLFFDLDVPLDQVESEPVAEVLTFSEWLDSTVIDESAAAPVLPEAFQNADRAAEKLSQRMQNISVVGLELAGGLLKGITNIIGSCGPLCLHGLANTVQAVPSFSAGVPGLSGLQFDGAGGFSLSGDVGSLARATGFSQKDLLAGKYSAEQVIAALYGSLAEGIGLVFGFGLINSLADMFFDSFMPSTASG